MEKIINVINTDLIVWLIKFRYKSTQGKFIVQGLGLIEVLNMYDQNGIEYIKEFDHKDLKFKRVSKDRVKRYFSMMEGARQYLAQHYYFK